MEPVILDQRGPTDQLAKVEKRGWVARTAAQVNLVNLGLLDRMEVLEETAKLANLGLLVDKGPTVE